MVRRGRLAEQEPHWVPFISKCGLHSDKDIAVLLSVDHEVIATGIEVS